MKTAGGGFAPSAEVEEDENWQSEHAEGALTEQLQEEAYIIHREFPWRNIAFLHVAMVSERVHKQTLEKTNPPKMINPRKVRPDKSHWFFLPPQEIKIHR